MFNIDHRSSYVIPGFVEHTKESFHIAESIIGHVVETAYNIASIPELMQKARAKVAKDTVINEGVLQEMEFLGDRRYVHGGYCAPIPDELPEDFQPPPMETKMRGKI